MPPPRRASSRNPDRFEIDEIATEFIQTYGAVILEDARRYSRNRADADDAYQRALEILITKAPTTDPEYLIPWIRTVVRREAIAIARSRHNSRTTSFDAEEDLRPSVDGIPEEAIDVMVDVEVGCEALHRLTLAQVSCLLAQAEGFTYDEIKVITGFTPRKVARSIHDGRRAFVKKVDQIASGAECERIEPLIQKVVDGDADAAIEIRPHLRHCKSCQARMRAYRSAGAGVAALFPPALVVVAPPPVGILEHVHHALSDLHERLFVKSHAAHQWAEAGVAKKFGVVATAAAVSVAGPAALKSLSQNDPRSPESSQAQRLGAAPSMQLVDVINVRRPARTTRSKASRRRPRKHEPDTSPVPTAQPPYLPPQATTRKAEPLDDGSSEFLPER